VEGEVKDSIRLLKHLIEGIESPILKREFQEWFKNNIQEFGIHLSISDIEIKSVKANYEDFIEFKKKAMVLEIGKQVIDACALTEFYQTPWGEKHQYRVFVVNTK
jgi:hypothetical protein